MKTLYFIVGILLVAGGLVSLITGGFAFTREKRDVSAGPVQISHASTTHVPVAPVVSVVALIAGGGLIVAGMRMR